MAGPTIRFTAAEYRQLPPEAPRVELIDGEFLMTPAPSIRHQDVAGRLYALLLNHLQGKRVGRVYISPVDVYLSESDVVQPDVVFILEAHSGRIQDNGIHGAPDLVIEVLSPSNAILDLTVKREIYRRSGVQEYWLVDPRAQNVAIYRFRDDAPRRTVEGDGMVETPLLPGLRVALSNLFSNP